MAESADLEKVTAKLPPSKARQLVSGVRASLTKAKRRREEVAELRQYAPLAMTVASTVGGAVAEVVRRKLVGRLTKTTRGQALGLLVAGYGVQKLADYGDIPHGRTVGAAHAAVAGMVASTEAYGTKDNPDPVALALEGTTHKALHSSAEQAK